jgi:hypothetical protein
MAWANSMGYVWAGAWNRSPLTAIAAAYLPLFFWLSWMLVPASSATLIAVLWSLTAVAFIVCMVAILVPSSYPLKITTMDLLVSLALPFGAYAYRRLRLK